VHAGYHIYSTIAADLAPRCHRAAIENRRVITMRFYAGLTLLAIDELRYLPRQPSGLRAVSGCLPTRFEDPHHPDDQYGGRVTGPGVGRQHRRGDTSR
jgi:hypothetical protein